MVVSSQASASDTRCSKPGIRWGRWGLSRRSICRSRFGRGTPRWRWSAAIVFAAVGTAGQRCTTLRRLFVHDSIADKLTGQLRRAYEQVRIGNPLEPGTLVGPLIGESAFRAMQQALDEARGEGARVYGGE